MAQKLKQSKNYLTADSVADTEAIITEDFCAQISNEFGLCFNRTMMRRIQREIEELIWHRVSVSQRSVARLAQVRLQAKLQALHSEISALREIEWPHAHKGVYAQLIIGTESRETYFERTFDKEPAAFACDIERLLERFSAWNQPKRGRSVLDRVNFFFVSALAFEEAGGTVNAYYHHQSQSIKGDFVSFLTRVLKACGPKIFSVLGNGLGDSTREYLRNARSSPLDLNNQRDLWEHNFSETIRHSFRNDLFPTAEPEEAARTRAEITLEVEPMEEGTNGRGKKERKLS